MNEEEIFTREEAAAFLKIDKGTVTQWIRTGRLAAAKITPGRTKPIPHLQIRLYCSLEKSDQQSGCECG
ncbi:helix-turn-helix domain-containing protein [Serratia ureilytica]